jgi:hypothetical protein
MSTSAGAPSFSNLKPNKTISYCDSLSYVAAGVGFFSISAGLAYASIGATASAGAACLLFTAAAAVSGVLGFVCWWLAAALIYRKVRNRNHAVMKEVDSDSNASSESQSGERSGQDSCEVESTGPRSGYMSPSDNQKDEKSLGNRFLQC